MVGGAGGSDCVASAVVDESGGHDQVALAELRLTSTGCELTLEGKLTGFVRGGGNDWKRRDWS